ncbi:MAG TPA: 2-oxo acid dehydrogenase subunit E2, partial [Bacteroidetes bacterium]|nr:2-oxo acid dehydrogenase subunit E2 [Bacteroidota bacterium]
SDTMVEGVIVAWHKKVGEEVASGELLAEIETDKATMELESFYDGVLLYTEVEENGAVPVGQLLAIIGDKGEDIAALVAEQKAKAAAAAAGGESEEEAEAVAPPMGEAHVAPAEADVSATSDDGRIKASPLAKAMAKERGIALAQVTGTGPEGRIVKRDIEDFKAPAAGTATMPRIAVGQESYTDEPVSQMRKTITRRLSESKFTAPHFYLTMEIDMENVWTMRKDINEVAPSKISFNDIIIKAVAMALRQHPKVNSSWRGDFIRYSDHIHIGMAVAIDSGLVVPVIRFADTLSFSQISSEAKRLAGLARDRKLQPSDWEGNTFTISNLGMFGIEEFTAIINSPDGGILAIGAIRDVPVVKNGAVVPGKTMRVTMSCDHRVVDGAVGSAFLVTLKQFLESPIRMMI